MGERKIRTDNIAIESLVKLTVNQEALANLLASPENCDDLILGHLLAEGHINQSTIIDKSDIVTRVDDYGTILVDVVSFCADSCDDLVCTHWSTFVVTIGFLVSFEINQPIFRTSGFPSKPKLDLV